MTTYGKPIAGAALALALISSTAFAASGGGGTTAPNASANPSSAQTPRPATTTTPSNTTQQHITVDPAPKGGAHTYHVVRPGSSSSHTTNTPNGNGNPG
jgi:hypothetical protein